MIPLTCRALSHLVGIGGVRFDVDAQEAEVALTVAATRSTPARLAATEPPSMLSCEF